MRIGAAILVVWTAGCGELPELAHVPSTTVPDTSSGPQSSPSDAWDAGWTARPDAGTSDVTRYPIVMAHGFAIPPNTSLANFGPIMGVLQDAGYAVFADDAPPFNSIAVRGAALLSTIETVVAQTGAPAVNIIAHSMGGQDARYVASPGGLGRGDLVASITMIGTPNQGTAAADLVNELIPIGGGVFLGAVSTAFNSFNLGIDLGNADVQAAFQDLAESYAPTFNAQTPDDTRVYYQSWANVANVNGQFDPDIAGACQAELYIAGAEGTLDVVLDPVAAVVGHGLSNWPNDGLVAVESAIWGNFRGCIPIDHFNDLGITETGVFPDPAPNTGFDLAGFYLDMVRDLAHRGF